MLRRPLLAGLRVFICIGVGDIQEEPSILILDFTSKRLKAFYLVDTLTSIMSLLNTIPAESYVGIIDGISVVWGPNAIANLPTNAEAYKVELNALKSATEKVAVACARRIGKTSVRILYEAIFNPKL